MKNRRKSVELSRRPRADLGFEKFRARIFSDESLCVIKTCPDGTKVNYGVSIEKLCKAIDDGMFP